MNFHLIIPSAGTGVRFKSRVPKQFYKIKGVEILAITIRRFHNFENLKSITIAIKKEYIKRIQAIIEKNNFYKVTKIIEGGKTRQQSVYNAICSLMCDRNDYVAIHDAVRPFVSEKFIYFLFKKAIKYKAIVPCIKINDTVKLIGKNKYIERTLNRDYIYLAQTPQIFRYDILKKSFDFAKKNNIKGTDDSSIVELAGFKVKVVEGDIRNIKITTNSDLDFVPSNYI